MSKTQEELFFDIKHAVLSYSQLVENYEFGCFYTTTCVMGVLQRTLTSPTEKVTAAGHCCCEKVTAGGRGFQGSWKYFHYLYFT